MAEDNKTEATSAPAPVKPEGEDKKKQASKPAPKPAQKKTDHAEPSAPKKGAPKEKKATGTEKKAAEATKRADASQGKSEVKIVDQPTEKKHVARAKPTLTPEQKKGLAQRREIADRRPWFRRQQWYEYKKLADSGWRKPTGIDSAMRRHFGYEQSVVRVGFGGPASVRGLHPSGFREVFVDQVEQLRGIDTKTEAARVSGRLGARKLKLLYAEADKLGVRILNRRNLE